MLLQRLRLWICILCWIRVSLYRQLRKTYSFRAIATDPLKLLPCLCYTKLSWRESKYSKQVLRNAVLHCTYWCAVLLALANNNHIHNMKECAMMIHHVQSCHPLKGLPWKAERQNNTQLLHVLESFLKYFERKPLTLTPSAYFYQLIRVLPIITFGLPSATPATLLGHD